MGFVTGEADGIITLRNIAGQVTKLRRADIRNERRDTKSMMPEGLAAGLTAEEFSAMIDYLASLKLLQHLGDFFVINISSPNTPGLRDLAQPNDLRKLLSTLQEFNHSCPQKKPLLLKISPDLEISSLPELVNITKEFELAGIVATNTTIHREPEEPNETGGLSGRPLTARAMTFTRALRPLLDKEQILVGVGGVMNSANYQSRRAAGADLVQIYTGMVYLGPRAAWEILKTS